MSVSCRSLILVGILSLTSLASADSVYRWTDDAGVVHYSSKPVHAGHEPADLPKIMKGDVKLTAATLVSCEPHGGVDCQAGADSDGSVICYDGFKNASPRFRFTCNSPKLELSDVSEPSKQGGFTVFIRNSKTVAAKKPTVSYAFPDGRNFPLEGPAEIAPLGVGEFIFKAPPGVAVSEKPTFAQLNVTCENCGK